MFLNLQPGCLGFGNVSLDERIRLACDCGYGGLDVPLDGLTEQSAAKARDKIVEAGLQCGLFWLPCDLSSADDIAFEQCLSRLRQLNAPVAQIIGLSRTYCHIWSSSNDRPFEQNWTWHVDRLRRMRDVLLPRGIDLGIEFLGPLHLRKMGRYGFIHNLAGALDLISAVGDGCGLVFDTFHWYCSGGTIEELPVKLANVRIVNVHVNDATAGRTREQQLDGERALPLETGLIDVKAIFGVLRDLNYDGPVIAEPFQPWMDRFKAMGAQGACRHIAQLMLPLMA